MDTYFIIEVGYLFCKSQATIILRKFDSPNKNNISNHLQWFRNSSDLYSAKYEKIILIEDFNVSSEESHMETFEFYGLKNLIKVPTCHKLAYSLWEIFLIGRNLKHVLMTYS